MMTPFRCVAGGKASLVRLATVDRRPVSPSRPYARLADCDGPLFAEYQRTKSEWDNGRHEPDAERQRLRQAAIAAYDAWALSCGMSPINTPKTWGFN